MTDLAPKRPDNYALERRSQPAQLLSVRGLPQNTHIDQLYLNGLHTPVPFWITNTSGDELRVSVRASADAGGSLKVQQHNLNWDAIPMLQQAAYIAVSSSLQLQLQPQPQPQPQPHDEVTMTCSSVIQREFSEVLNLVDGDGQLLSLAPGETAELVLLLRGAEESPPETKAADHPTSEAAGSLCRFATCAGSVFIQAAGDTFTSNIRASFCRSVLEMEPATSRVYLDDCVVGRVYERMLRIRNASEIALEWTMDVVETTDAVALETALQLRLVDRPGALEYSGVSGAQISGSLSGGACQQISVRYTPQAVGEFLCRFALENANDAVNTRHWVFRARASQRAKPRRVELLSTGEIDFGDCTSGVWYRRDVTLKNIGETTMVVRFRVEGNVNGLAVRVHEGPGLGPGASAGVGAGADRGSDSAALPPVDDTSEQAAAISELDIDAAESVSLGSETINTPTLASGTRDSATAPGGGNTSSSMVDSSRRASIVGRRNRPHGHGHSSQGALLEEILIKPGSVRTVALSLMGNGSSGGTGSGGNGQFLRQSFTLFCECSAPTSAPTAKLTATAPAHAERLSLPCTLNMCTPVVRVTPPLLDFGAVDVGTIKSMYLTIENLSPVPATVVCALESKVINCTRAPIVVAPRQSETVRVDIYPRRINTRYRKQIIVRNMHGRGNDSTVVDVRSVHVDQRRMAYHNLFYKTLVGSSEQNFVDFGPVPLRARAVRQITLENLCRCPIALELAVSDVQCIGIFTAIPVPTLGMVSPEARQAARLLLQLERQAEMHSSIERLKELQPTTEQRAVRFMKPRDLADSVAAASGVAAEAETLPVCKDAVLNSSTEKMSIGFNSGIFVDKRIEGGHVSLTPFGKSRRKTSPSAIGYLDAAIANWDSPGRLGRHASTVRVWTQRAASQGVDAVCRVPLPAPLADKSASDSGTDNESEDTTTIRMVKRAWEILQEIVDHLDMMPQTLFSSIKAEDEYVRRQVDLRNYVGLLIEAGFLQPVERLALPALGKVPVVVMLRPLESAVPNASSSSGFGATPTRFDANLYFKLIDRPAKLLAYVTASGGISSSSSANNVSIGGLDNSYQLPVRRFLIQASLRRAELDVGQKSINVGNMQVDEACRKYLIIQNRSEAAVMYAIRKTGSIASGDIQFVDNNRYGVVRAFDSHKVVFVFKPSLNGIYNEQISITNVLDEHSGRTATLKAVVRRPSKFYIASLELKFDDGLLQLGQRSSQVQTLTLRNMTAKTRKFTIRCEESIQSSGAVWLDVQFPEDVTVSGGLDRLLDREAEEKIEVLEQKIKIAVRKNRPEKVEKYRAKIAKLRAGTAGSGTAAETGAGPGAEADSSAHTGARAETGATEGGKGHSHASTFSVEHTQGGRQATVTLNGMAEAHIPVVVVPLRGHAKEPATHVEPRQGSEQQAVEAKGQFLVHEEKDKDNVKIVNVSGSVACSPEDLDGKA